MNLKEYNKQRRIENRISIILSILMFIAIGYVISVLGEMYLW